LRSPLKSSPVTVDAAFISTPATRDCDSSTTSYITNALDRNERMSFIQKQVGHTTTRMIVDHYYRHVPAPDDGDRLEEAWNSTTLLPPSKDADLQLFDIMNE
jgi:integrase